MYAPVPKQFKPSRLCYRQMYKICTAERICNGTSGNDVLFHDSRDSGWEIVLDAFSESDLANVISHPGQILLIFVVLVLVSI